MTDSLITGLARVPGLLVIARHSAFQYKNRTADVRDVGKALGVRYVLEGSVQRAGDSVRVNAQLVDSDTGYHLWADKYDRPMKDIFAVQDDISRHIIGSLKLAFGRTPQPYFRPVDAGTETYREVYWRLYVRYPTDWQGGGGDKLSRATSFPSEGSWAQSMIAHVWSGGNSTTWDYLVLDPASGTDTAGTLRTTTYNDFSNLRWLGSARGSTALFAPAALGRWHCVEAHARLNDAGTSNGQFELWIDGQLDAHREGLNWIGRLAGYGINAVFIENYWNAGAPVVEARYLDNLVVSTQRIGCPA